MTELTVERAPLSSLGSDLKSDLVARVPAAQGWGPVRKAWAFVADPSLQAALTMRLVLCTPGRFLFLWRTWNIARFRMEIFRIAVGPGVHLPHPVNILIGPGTTIGARATIHSGVNVGFARAPEPGMRMPCPEIGDDVTLGASCMVVGDITVGDGARIEPGALVTRDVEPGAVVKAGR